jgi:rhomboid protease GluP
MVLEIRCEIMDAYIRNLIDNLCNIYGYRVVEFNDVSGLGSRWGAVKKDGDMLDVVFFSNLQTMEELDINNFISYTRNTLKYENIRPIQVLVDSDLKAQADEEGVFHLNHKINPQCGLILINNVDNKILYYSSGLENRVNELVNCINYRINAVSKSEKAERAIVTYILIAVNVLVFALTAYLSGSIFNSNINVLVLLGAKVNELISQGQYYRLVTCMFLHGGIIHITLNMYSLYFLGPLIEGIYGKVKYLAVYFISGILASMFSYWFSPDISIGASGAIFGLLGAALVFAIKMRDRIRKEFIANVLSVIGVNLIIGFSIPNVDNFAHLGGLIGGIITSFFLFRSTSQYLHYK